MVGVGSALARLLRVIIERWMDTYKNRYEWMLINSPEGHRNSTGANAFRVRDSSIPIPFPLPFASPF